ncbi:MAG: DUF4124 domain-containing protein [Pseudomonadota bacterium]
MLMRLSVMVMGLCMASLASVSMAQAGVYKWKDANGRVHYGDQAPSGAEKVKTGPDNSEAAPVEGNGSDAEKQQQKKIEECSRKRDQLTTYKKASRIVETDSLGNKKEFNDEERQKLIDRTQKDIADGCGELTDSEGAPAN